jgi:CxxC motif-containing protein
MEPMKKELLKNLICILCPNGCEISAMLDEDGIIQEIEGASCQRGGEYARQEIYDPRRNIATSVKVTGGELPLVSVRLTKAIPKEKIFEVMAEIKKAALQAPVSLGDVIIANVLGLGADVIATKDVLKI